MFAELDYTPEESRCPICGKSFEQILVSNAKSIHDPAWEGCEKIEFILKCIKCDTLVWLNTFLNYNNGSKSGSLYISALDYDEDFNQALCFWLSLEKKGMV